jgi:hypothetical protein
MTTVTTNYVCKNGSGVYQDLSAIFQSYSSGTQIVTGFEIPSGQDLGSIFEPLGSGTAIDFFYKFYS